MYKNYKLLSLPICFLLLSACTSYGNIINEKIETTPSTNYSLHKTISSHRSNDVTVVLAFSGGGTRAAALAYGVLEALRDTSITLDGKPHRLLDEVDLISSVSGGSFTAAYFGLHGDKIFSDFETKFLRRNVTGELMHGLFNPLLWFSSRGRTEMAVNFYEDNLFKGATFADLYKKDGPLIVINATDLGGGIRFSFLQEYFDLICSNLSTYPIARAVTASSAVPVLFNPVVVKNHSGCETRAVSWLNDTKHLTTNTSQPSHIADSLRSYAQKDTRQYIHLVDGGITDNLGLLALYEMVDVAGGISQFLDIYDGKPAPYFLVISVNASTSPQYGIESTNETPTIENIINSVSDVQLHRDNTATLELLKDSVKRWSAELSTTKKPVTSYFVEVDFNSIAQTDRRLFFNQIPSSFSLTADQVDDLITTGRELLRNNREFQRFTDALNGAN